MTIGNWRDHLLIKCAVCSKLMGHYKPSTTATCVDCEILARAKAETIERGKNLLDRLKFNGAHMDDKNALTVGQLQTLADANYSDISWSNNECASFGSDCLRYELFVNLRTDNARDEFHAVHYENDGDSTFFHSGESLVHCLAAIESHKRGLL